MDLLLRQLGAFELQPVVKVGKAMKDFFHQQYVEPNGMTQRAAQGIARAYRKLAEHKRSLSEDLRVLYLLEGSGLNEQQTAAVLAAAGNMYERESVTNVLQVTYSYTLPGYRGSSGPRALLLQRPHDGRQRNPQRHGNGREADRSSNFNRGQHQYPRRVNETTVEDGGHGQDPDGQPLDPDDIDDALDNADANLDEHDEDEPSELTAEVNAAATTCRQARQRLQMAVQARGFYKDTVSP